MLRFHLQYLGDFRVRLRLLFMSHVGVKVCTEIWQQVASYAVLENQLLGSHAAARVDGNAEASLTPGIEGRGHILVYTAMGEGIIVKFNQPYWVQLTVPLAVRKHSPWPRSSPAAFLTVSPSNLSR